MKVRRFKTEDFPGAKIGKLRRALLFMSAVKKSETDPEFKLVKAVWGDYCSDKAISALLEALEPEQIDVLYFVTRLNRMFRWDVKAVASKNQVTVRVPLGAEENPALSLELRIPILENEPTHRVPSEPFQVIISANREYLRGAAKQWELSTITQLMVEIAENGEPLSEEKYLWELV